MYKYFLCLLIISSSFSYDGFRQGEIELSGNAEYNITMRDSSPSVNTFIFQPNTSIYFQDGLFIGPFIQWGRQWDNRSTSNVLGLGGNIGYLFKNESGTYPY